MKINLKESNCHPGRLHYAKGVCKKCYNKQIRYKNKPNKIKTPNYAAIKYIYGIDKDDLDKLILHQQNRCAVCSILFGQTELFEIDHCHKSGDVRGLLCGVCNNLRVPILDTWRYLSYKLIAYIDKDPPFLGTYTNNSPNLNAPSRRKFRRYGLDQKMIETLLLTQNSKCVVCAADINIYNLHIDHDLYTRGASCSHICAIKVSLLRENRHLLSIIMGYIMNPPYKNIC